VILIPEIQYSIEGIAKKIKAVKETGRNFALIIVSEAVQTPEGDKREVVYHGGETRYGGIAQFLAPQIATATGFETRATVLGHVQRGGEPTHNDRILAQGLGVKAVDLIADGIFGKMVAWRSNEAVAVPIEDAIAVCRVVDKDGFLVHTARSLGVSFGD
jgi:6-phosphofructokinase 1